MQLMSDQSLQTSPSNNTPQANPPAAEQLPPPSGDLEKAEQYITQLIKLIHTDKLLIVHTDLSKFNPTSLQDHYSLDLKDYETEISHNKQPDSGQDLYIILFNNLKYVNETHTEKVILAYIHLTEKQFKSFKFASDEQIERKRREAEEKRFKEAMNPVDQILDQLATISEEAADDEVKVEQPKEESTDSRPLLDDISSTPPATDNSAMFSL